MRQLSSSWTFFRKMVMPVLLVGFAGFFVAGFADGWKDIIGYSLLSLFGGGAVYIGEHALKRVRMDGDMLYISNFRDEIILPIEEIKKIECYSNGRRLYQVRLYCQSTTPFGREIDFSPERSSLLRIAEHLSTAGFLSQWASCVEKSLRIMPLTPF